jgi:signal transduction histidine kinase
VKYSPSGTTVTVRVEAAGETAILAVEDEGDGIPIFERQRVFEAFYRASEPAVAGTRGSGIGLAVVKEVAERLQARVLVEDSPPGGARLVVVFRGAAVPPRSPVLAPGGTHGN